MLAPTTFFFKNPPPSEAVLQRNIARSDVETPSVSVAANIVALYQLENNNLNSDPNAHGIYGDWAAATREYRTHIGILNDNGFSRYLYNSGLQINGWVAGAADTYYNLGGMTFSWIARVTPATGKRLMQFWQADIEHIEVYFSSATEITLAVMLGTGTLQTATVDTTTSAIGNGTFHHYAVTFHPGAERVARLYINGTLVATTAAVAGAVVFGDTAVNIRRGIAFGSLYSDPDVQVAGDIDHAVILRGLFTPVDPAGDGMMLHETIFMKYFNDQMLYNPGIDFLTIGTDEFLVIGPDEFLVT